MQSPHEHPIPPGGDKLLWELPRAAREFFSLGDVRWRRHLKKAPKGDGHAVMTIPGFGGGDGCMSMLRRYLNSIGYTATPWGLGTNIITEKAESLDEILVFCEQKEAQIVEQLERIADQTGERVSLVGWSLGGIYANVIAQTHPELVRQIITLGSPIGDPRGTSVWNIMKKAMGGELPDHMQNVHGWVQRKDQLAERKVRTSILWSDNDGAVSRGSAVIDNHHMVENIQVPSSHVGFAHNPLVYLIIANRLSQCQKHWNAFCPSQLPPIAGRHISIH